MGLRTTCVLLALAASACNTIAGIGEPSPRDDASQPGADGPSSGESGSETGSDAAMAFDSTPDAATSESSRATESGSGTDASSGADTRSEAAVEAAVSLDSGFGRDSGSIEAGASPILFRSSWSGGSRSISIAVQRPMFVKEGDLLWMALYSDLQSTMVTAPSGWSKTERPNNHSDFRSTWFWRFAAADDPTEWVFSLSQETVTWAGIVAYEGVDRSTPFDNGTVADTSGTPCVAPSVHASGDTGVLFVISFVSDTAKTWTPVGPMNVRVDYDGVFIADFPQVGPGDTGTHAVGCTPAGDGAVMALGLLPANR